MVIRDFKIIVAGNPAAEAVSSPTALSFWGGVDVVAGRIQDVHHDLCGESIRGKILCIPCDRGSCSGSGVMLEMLRLGTNPAGILCIEAEPVLALGPVIGSRMYGRSLAIRTIAEEDFRAIPRCCRITFTEDAILVDEESEEEE